MAKGGTTTMGGSVRSVGTKGSAGIRIGGPEGRVGGNVSTQFSSRVFADAARPTLGRRDITPAGRKVAIGAEKASAFSFARQSGESSSRVGLGDKTTAIGLGRTRGAVPETRSVRIETMDKPTQLGRDIIKRSGKYGLPVEKPFEVRPSDTAVREKSILQEIQREYTRHRPSERSEPIILSPATESVTQPPQAQELLGAQRAITIEAVRGELQHIAAKKAEAGQRKPSEVIVEPSPQLQRLAAQNIVHQFSSEQSSVRPTQAQVEKTASNAAVRYLRVLARKEAVKAGDEEEEVNVKKKPDYKGQALAVIGRLQTTVAQRLQILQRAPSNGDVQAERLRIAQTVAEVRGLVQKQRVGLSQDVTMQPELARLTAPLAVNIAYAENHAQHAVDVQAVPKVDQQSERRGILPEIPDNDDPKDQKPKSSVVVYSVDESAAQARLIQVIDAAEVVLTNREDFESVSGAEVVSSMEGETIATTSDIVKDASKKLDQKVYAVDGSDPEWRNDLAVEDNLTKNTLIEKAWKIIRAKPPVKRGAGDGVSEEDKDRVRRPKVRSVVRQALLLFPLF